MSFAALPGPHQPPGVVVDHAQQKPLPFAVEDLVDPDPAQPGEAVGAPAGLGDHPHDDGGHRPPGDPQQLQTTTDGAA